MRAGVGPPPPPPLSDDHPAWADEVWASPLDVRRRIFCNRSLNMSQIRAVGFDMASPLLMNFALMDIINVRDRVVIFTAIPYGHLSLGGVDGRVKRPASKEPEFRIVIFWSSQGTQGSIMLDFVDLTCPVHARHALTSLWWLFMRATCFALMAMHGAAGLHVCAVQAGNV